MTGPDDVGFPWQPFAGRELRDVLVPARQPEQSLQVVSVELYADGLIVRWLDLEPKRISAQELGITPSRWERLRRLLGRNHVDWENAWDEGYMTGSHIGGGYRGLRVTDDAGTTYIGLTGGSHGSPDVMRGESAFTPAVPDEATRLRITGDGVLVEMPLNTARG